jgi:cobalt-zinc-cadmium efflux system membrane fusion protein
MTTEPVTEQVAPPPPSRAGTGLFLVLVGLGMGIAADRFLPVPWRQTESAPSPALAATRAEAPFTRVGERITVPPGSLLRTQLVVAEAAQKEVARTLVLPAMVESDPARTVKVLPPVAGRVTELKVQLGERVKEGQELAVSPKPIPIRKRPVPW